MHSVLGTLLLCTSCVLPASASLHKSGVYIGSSFGVSQLSGKRTDTISDGINPFIIFSNKKMNDTSLEASLFAGYRYVPSQTNLVFSLDGSFSYGPYTHTVYRDLTGFFANQVATLTRGIGYGITGRVGYIVHQQLMPYLLIGSRIDRFTYSSTDSSAVNLGVKKLLVGSDFGGGIETCLGGLKTALEFKYTYYHRETRFVVQQSTGHFVGINARPQSASISLRFTHIF